MRVRRRRKPAVFTAFVIVRFRRRSSVAYPAETDRLFHGISDGFVWPRAPPGATNVQIAKTINFFKNFTSIFVKSITRRDSLRKTPETGSGESVV